MTSQFVVRTEAEADIEEAGDWHQSRSVQVGTRFLDSVERALDWIRDNPQRFPVVHAEDDVRVRRALVPDFPYGLYFIWNERSGAIRVIACMHGKRDPRRWLERA